MAVNVGFVLAIVALVLSWTFTLRPVKLGGPASYVMVRGVSMVPTYHTGDLVIVHRQDAYHNGDVIAFRIPEGDMGAGTIVFHRIVGVSSGAGFVVRGDNNPAPDDWHPTPRDILGTSWFLIPRGGTLLAFLHAPLPLASLAAGLAVALLAVPAKGRTRMWYRGRHRPER